MPAHAVHTAMVVRPLNVIQWAFHSDPGTIQHMAYKSWGADVFVTQQFLHGL